MRKDAGVQAPFAFTASARNRYHKLELRALDLKAFRKLMGRALGVAPRRKIYRAYIEVELQLGAVTAELAKRWKELSAEERAPFETAAEEDKAFALSETLAERDAALERAAAAAEAEKATAVAEARDTAEARMAAVSYTHLTLPTKA